MSLRLVASTLTFLLLLCRCPAAAVPRSIQSDAELARQLPGTWEKVLTDQHRDLIVKNVFTTFRADQTFTGLAIDQLGGIERRIDVRGTWRIENGVLVEKITDSSAQLLVPIGGATSGRIVSISPDEFVARSAQGQEERIRRSRIPTFIPPLLSSDIAFFLKKPRLGGSAIQKAIVAAPKPIYPLEARRNRKIGKRALWTNCRQADR